jgi:hypothetical protein
MQEFANKRLRLVLNGILMFGVFLVLNGHVGLVDQ